MCVFQYPTHEINSLLIIPGQGIKQGFDFRFGSDLIVRKYELADASILSCIQQHQVRFRDNFYLLYDRYRSIYAGGGCMDLGLLYAHSNHHQRTANICTYVSIYGTISIIAGKDDLGNVLGICIYKRSKAESNNHLS